MYKLEDEPELKFSVLLEIDGGNSLKRTNVFVRNVVERIDTRGPRTDYRIPPEEVDEWKDEVKARTVISQQCHATLKYST
jgi:hypothetical protein